MSDYGLTEGDREAIRARLVSWFGDDQQEFLLSHLAPVIDRIKADGYMAGAMSAELWVSEAQWNALQMARKADLAERRAEDTEAELERLKAAADLVGHQAACLVDPCDCWMSDLAPLLEYERPEWRKVAEVEQGSGTDAWTVAVFEEQPLASECGHQWIDRPESDTVACDLCGEER